MLGVVLVVWVIFTRSTRWEAPAARLIERIAAFPRSGRAAIAFIAALTMLVSLISWAVSLIFSGLLVPHTVV